MRHRRADQISAGRQRLAEFDETGTEPDQRLGKGAASVTTRPARAHQPVKPGA